jgi:hypothetical protein
MRKIKTACMVAASIGLLVGAVDPIIGLHAVQLIQTRAAVGNRDLMPTEVTYPQLYTSADGETHFREVRVPLTTVDSAPPSPPSAQSELQPATTIRHVAYPANWGTSDRDRGTFHNASSARFISVRRGALWIKTSDGETRRFQAGDVVEVLDLAPSKGHVTWAGDEGSAVLFSNHS